MFKSQIITGIILMTLHFIQNPASAGSDSYVLETGKKGGQRLDFQHDLIRKDSYEHLEKAGVAKGQIVWDIGCGNGTITEYLAKIVGETGHVYGIDISPAQLEEAKERLQKAELQNVTFIQADIQSFQDLPREKADIVYIRYVLTHLRNPEKAIANIKQMLKPKGIVATQDCIMNTSRINSHNPVFDDFFDNLLKLGQAKGVDYNLGERLEDLYQKAGFKNVTSYKKPLENFTGETAQQFLSMFVSEWKEKAIEEGIVTRPKVITLEKALKTILQDEPLFYFVPAMQVYALAQN